MVANWNQPPKKNPNATTYDFVMQLSLPNIYYFNQKLKYIAYHLTNKAWIHNKLHRSNHSHQKVNFIDNMHASQLSFFCFWNFILFSIFLMFYGWQTCPYWYFHNLSISSMCIILFVLRSKIYLPALEASEDILL